MDTGTVTDGGGDSSPDTAIVDTFVPPTAYTPGVGYPFDADPLVLDDANVAGVDPESIPDLARSPCMEPVLVTVTRIIDGDTIFVNATGLAERVRMIGVDTPELASDGRPAECYGDEARAFTGALQGRQVWMTFDGECRDPFDRLLAYIWIGDGPQDLWARHLIRRGYARTLSIAPNTSFADLLLTDQGVASGADSGMWGACP